MYPLPSQFQTVTAGFVSSCRREAEDWMHWGEVVQLSPAPWCWAHWGSLSYPWYWFCSWTVGSNPNSGLWRAAYTAGMQSRCSAGEEAALLLLGVVAPAAPWCSWPSCTEKFSSGWRSCSASLGNLSPVASQWRLQSIPAIPIMLRSSWYCKQVHSSSA